MISHSIFLFAEYEAYRRNLSREQFEIAYPIRSFYDRVEHTALASDNPATAWSDADNVFVSIKAAVLREAYNAKAASWCWTATSSPWTRGRTTGPRSPRP
ncbi:hypothetical protein [Saccharopolyspora karakumensis]|uniref:hypothetical protein n=1 Tax=Saccharopolyspora karakumensis TaxID=2530386 RepID=UPI001404F114|nr:hypothetical protein [Saccharopolyspora karakumensis]